MMAVEKGRDGAPRTRKKSKARRRKQGETDEQFQRRTAKMNADRDRRQKERDDGKRLRRERPEEVLYANYAPRHVDHTTTLEHITSWAERQRERLAEMVAQQDRSLASLRKLAYQESSPDATVSECASMSGDVKKVDDLSTRELGPNLTSPCAPKVLKSIETVGTFFASTEMGGDNPLKGVISPTPKLRENETCKPSEPHNKPAATLVREEIHPIFATQSDHAEDPVTTPPAAIEVGVEPSVPALRVPRLLLGSSVELTVERGAEMALVTGWLTQVRVVFGAGAQVLRFGDVERAGLSRVLRACFAVAPEAYVPGKILSGRCPGFAVYAVALRKALHGCALTMASTTVLELLRCVEEVAGPAPVGLAPSADRVASLYRSVVEGELRAGTFVLLGT